MSETRPPMTAGPIARALSLASAGGSSTGPDPAPAGGDAGRDFGAWAERAPPATEARRQGTTAARGSGRRVLDGPLGAGDMKAGGRAAATLSRAARAPGAARADGPKPAML